MEKADVNGYVLNVQRNITFGSMRMTKPNRRLFVLTKTLYKKLKNSNRIKRCYFCGKEFNIGDKVKSVPRKNSSVSGSRKWICLNCMKKYNIW